MKVQMENYKPCDEILKFKDIVIWNLIEENRKQLEIVVQEEKVRFYERLEQWTK